MPITAIPPSLLGSWRSPLSHFHSWARGSDAVASHPLSAAVQGARRRRALAHEVPRAIRLLSNPADFFLFLGRSDCTKSDSDLKPIFPDQMFFSLLCPGYAQVDFRCFSTGLMSILCLFFDRIKSIFRCLDTLLERLAQGPTFSRISTSIFLNLKSPLTS